MHEIEQHSFPSNEDAYKGKHDVCFRCSIGEHVDILVTSDNSLDTERPELLSLVLRPYEGCYCGRIDHCEEFGEEGPSKVSFRQQGSVAGSQKMKQTRRTSSTSNEDLGRRHGSEI